MNSLTELLQNFTELFVWWTTVRPWEAGIRIRLGKQVHHLSPGIHLRIPYIDEMYVESTRLRSIQMPPQDLTTKDGRYIMIKTVLQFKVVDFAYMRAIRLANESNWFHGEQDLKRRDKQ